MGYSVEVVRRARERLAQAREDRESENRQHLAEAYAKVPRIREIDMQLRRTMALAAQAAFLQGSDGREEMDKVRSANLQLQRERAELAAEYFEEGYLDDSPICDRCGGSGYLGTQMCECLAELCRQEQKKEISILSGGKEHFAQFRLDYYPDRIDPALGVNIRSVMEKTFQSCKRYALTFSEKSGNLLFSGDTGLGKTFLSACIARTVAERGYSVVYESAGNLFTKMEAYEPWVDDAKYLPEIGVLCQNENYFNPTYSGLARILGELKYNFDFVDEDMDFSRFPVMILPELVTMSDKLAEKLSDYLAKGGKVLFAGAGALNESKTGFALKELDFVTFHGEDNTKTAYYQPLGDTSDGLPVRSMYEPGILMTAKDSGDVLAKYVKPYFDRHWDGKHGYYYTPPTKEAPYDAVVRHGSLQLISFNVFAAYNHYASAFHKKLVKECLENALPCKRICASNLPSYARATVTGTEDYTLLHVKVTYPEARGGSCAIEEHNILPAGRTIGVKGTYQKVMCLPTQEAIPFRTENGYAVFELPEITGYQMFCLEK